MLETEIKKLTAALEANTAARLGGATAAARLGGATAVAASGLAAAVAAPAPADVTASVAETAPVPAATIEIEMPPEIPTTVAVPAADLKQITEGIVALCRAKGRDAAGLLLAEYGAQKVPDLKKVSDKYGEILAKINAAIAA